MDLRRRAHLACRPDALARQKHPELRLSGGFDRAGRFDIDSFRKHCLLNGLDAIGLTLEKKQSIENFEATATATRPWLDLPGR